MDILRMSFSVTLFALLALSGDAASAAPAPDANSQGQIILSSIRSGDDWTLPPSVQPKSGTGYYDSPPELQNEDIKTLVLTWKELNPAEGVYNWSRLDEALANHRIWLRLYSTDVIHVPDWLLQKYPSAPRMKQNTGEGPTYPDLLGNRSPAVFVAPWHPGINREFLMFMKAFGKRNFLASKNMVFMYAPGAWRWTEWVSTFVGKIREQGLTPETYFDWFKQYIDAYVSASNGFAHKLVFTGYGTVEKFDGDQEFILKLNDLDTGLNRMTDYAVRAGMGVRVGDLEYFNQFDAMPAWGAPFITQDGFNYQTIDTSHPLRADPRRIIATENEGFGDPGMLRGTSDSYYVKMVTLKSLQLGMNWLNIQHYGYKLNPAVTQYSRKVLGKTARESPDAWVALRSFRDMLYVPSGETIPGMPKAENFIRRAKGEFRNWERYLIQREISPGGQTRPADPNQRMAGADKSNGPSFEAIRTDLASGNDSIYFKLDKVFAASAAQKPVTLKVTYQDTAASWLVGYHPAGNNIEITGPVITGSKTGQWKTATFVFPAMPVSNDYTKDMDFRLVAKSGDNLTVRFVRLVKN
jgi:hypothetical protein